MALILDGNKARDEIAGELAKRIAGFESVPGLAILQIGDNPASGVYIKQKQLFGEKIGAEVNLYKFPEDVRQNEITETITKLNADQKTHGIILQLPIPENLEANELIEKISPQKDVDGLTTTNTEKVKAGDQSGFLPATTKAILTLLDYYQIPIDGKDVVVIGRSALVGRPTALALGNLGATVTVCHRGTTDLSAHTKTADLIVVATGQAKLLKAGHLNTEKKSTVIDVGITRTKDGLIGDTDFENIKDIVGAISPVPGGVGPLTVASLFTNLVKTYNNL
ncbi:MAG: bifunctional 5,10-methylenetetrahydrofolate dehydrogenase/5,10-methenyltetrahydrofolate cyclohydrolase [Patescibacteria group bacterium]|nr:bifunctional 5,10-methylenetetrahydrofolate dehydrogenase/5,10-methenyltetrahydrofolate cyclohydrolase [Patescibacteria group bacterium]